MSFETAYASALLRLRRSDCFTAEIRRELANYGEADVSRVVERLGKHGLLNDEKLAAKIVLKSAGKAAVGRELLAEKMRMRGAEETVIHAAFVSLPAEIERAKELVASRPSAAPATLRRFLISRGFESEIVDEALDHQFGASE